MIKRALSLLLLLVAPLVYAQTVRLGDAVVPVSQSINLTTDPASDAYNRSVTSSST
jgi:hypothetical protein